MKTTTTLSKEDFIRRSMNGERFEFREEIYYYDDSQNNPFRVDGICIQVNWRYFDGKNIFTVVKAKKTIVLEEWLMEAQDGGYYVFEATPDYLGSLHVKQIQKLSERVVEVEVEKAKS